MLQLSDGASHSKVVHNFIKHLLAKLMQLLCLNPSGVSVPFLSGV